jgi:hypothetical protein
MEHPTAEDCPDLTGVPEWWDPYSEQPRTVPAYLKPRTGPANLIEYARVGAASLALAPLIAWRYGRPKPSPAPIEARDFVGLSISPKPGLENATAELVEELGVRLLLCRVPAWESDRVGDYRTFIDRFPDHRFVINVLQCRDSVDNPHLWRRQLDTIFRVLGERTEAFQIGNAINRTKWGCKNSGEYLRLLAIADEVRRAHPGVRLAGSSVIDFEPLIALRTLVNSYRFRIDHCALQLYVNRRGSPFNRQFGLFDLERKLRLLHAILRSSRRCPPSLWITETNWPLLGTRPYTPNSGHPRSTVDEPTQAAYLTDYYRIAHASGLVERVYWWQLINPGYGLVDHRGGTIRRMPSFFAMKRLLEGGLGEAAVPG